MKKPVVAAEGGRQRVAKEAGGSRLSGKEGRGWQVAGFRGALGCGASCSHRFHRIGWAGPVIRQQYH